MFPRRAVLAFLCAALIPGMSFADKPMIHADHGLAIGGYDTVAYFTDGQAVKGDSRYSVMWKGAVWLFASAEHRDMFEMNPRHYAPRFGGYCAYGMARGRAVSSSPEVWVIRDGRLYLVNNPGVAERWNQDPDHEIAEAVAHWPTALRN